MNDKSKHPIVWFAILTCLWSWGIWSMMLLFVSPGELFSASNPLVYLSVILGGFGPSLSGLLLTKLLYGKKGLKLLFARLNLSAIKKHWSYLFLIPLTTLLTPLLRHLLGSPLTLEVLGPKLFPGLLLGIVAGLMEEFGWRGFLLPELRKHNSPVQATLILGLIWGGLWHGYADYLGLGPNWLLIFLLGPLLLTAWSFILTAVHELTHGNLLMSILLHASISSSAFILSTPYANPREELLWSFISVCFATIVSVIFFTYQSRKHSYAEQS